MSARGSIRGEEARSSTKTDDKEEQACCSSQSKESIEEGGAEEASSEGGRSFEGPSAQAGTSKARGRATGAADRADDREPRATRSASARVL